MRYLIAAAALALSMPASGATVASLLTRDLVGVPGKDVAMITVTLAPGEANPVHRHNANVFVYVLEGAVAMQVEGQPAVTLQPGGTFYESPADVHLVSRNASTTAPARFLVFFVKDKGAPLTIPANR